MYGITSRAFRRLWAGGGLALLAGLGAGCTTTAMKGTPFYTGEYTARRGPAENRVNGWPLVYYRDPALSVCWPIFECTDEHIAVRPVFSVYQLDKAQHEYNVFWPLMQFDRLHHENRIFPLFWGPNHRVLFPLYWHFDHPLGKSGGADWLFPLWGFGREGADRYSLYCPWPVLHFMRTPSERGWHVWPLAGRYTDRNGCYQFQLWPLLHQWSHDEGREAGSTAVPLYWRQRDADGSLFLSWLWMSGADAQGGSWQLLPPFYFRAAGKDYATLVTPLWAQGGVGTNRWHALIPFCYWEAGRRTWVSPLWASWTDGAGANYLAPWLLSGLTRRPERSDLWLTAGLAHWSWGPQTGDQHVLPLYYRAADKKMFLTPLFGWRGDDRGFFYPLTPLAGVRTGAQRSGSWFFPLYGHSRDAAGDRVEDHYLLLGGYERTGSKSHAWLFPLFNYNNLGPLETTPRPEQRYATYGKDFWCLPFCWYKNKATVHPAPAPVPVPSLADVKVTSALPGARIQPVKDTRPLVRDRIRENGFFPLWSYERTLRGDGDRTNVAASVLLWLWDTKRELAPAGRSGARHEYIRTRVLWRLWHYERLNGDVGVDLFPGFTFDRKSDGYKKISWLWRVFRYERGADGSRKLDVLFIPLRRQTASRAAA